MQSASKSSAHVVAAAEADEEGVLINEMIDLAQNVLWEACKVTGKWLWYHNGLCNTKQTNKTYCCIFLYVTIST